MDDEATTDGSDHESTYISGGASMKGLAQARIELFNAALLGAAAVGSIWLITYINMRNAPPPAPPKGSCAEQAAACVAKGGRFWAGSSGESECTKIVSVE
jgi:hypothetical protein